MFNSYDKSILNQNPKMQDGRSLKQHLGAWQLRLNCDLNHLKADLQENGLKEYTNVDSDVFRAFENFCVQIPSGLDQSLLQYVKSCFTAVYQGDFNTEINFRNDVY